jgi:hypothetical protein
MKSSTVAVLAMFVFAVLALFALDPALAQEAGGTGDLESVLTSRTSKLESLVITVLLAFSSISFLACLGLALMNRIPWPWAITVMIVAAVLGSWSAVKSFITG